MIQKQCDVIIIGGGAAGLMCAIEAGKRGRKVIVLEHNDRVGKKILISGGGRCNFTNINATFENYLSQNPHFCKSALARYQPHDFIALVESHGIRYHEKKLGQLFCDLSSRLIVEMLEAECREKGVVIKTSCRVTGVQKSTNFTVTTTGESWTCDSLVIACGGLSFPKIGATGFGYDIARQFGHTLVSCRPGLVPLRLKEAASFEELAGISLDVNLSLPEIQFRENLLFTHQGLSGPAILQISSYLPTGGAFQVNLLPDKSPREFLESQRTGNKELKTVLSQIFPQRFAHKWCEIIGSSLPINRYTPLALDKIAEDLQTWPITPTDTEGYAKAEVTVGGVNTRELSSKTMESRNVAGLFFVGEVMDVTGWLGGYNFQWAWASGHAAGQFV